MSALRRTTAAAALAAAGLLALCACGSATAVRSAAAPADTTPRAELAAAAARLGDSDGATATFTVAATADQLRALGATASQVAAVTGGSVVVAARPGDGGGLGVDVDAGNEPHLAQLVAVDHVLYLRGDTQALTADAGTVLPSALRALTSSPPLQAALASGWVSLDLTGPLASVAPSTTASTSTLLSRLSAVLGSDVQVRRAAPDPSRGDHLVVTADARSLGTDLTGALRSALPAAAGPLGTPSPSQLPDTDVTVDAYVRDGELDAVTVNLTPLLPAARQQAVHGAAIDLDVAIRPGATVSAPAHATRVDLASLLAGLVGGHRSATASPAP